MSFLSLADLPYDANGGLTGKWLVKLRDHLNAFHAGTRWEDGKTVEPVAGHVLRRFVAASTNVVGAVRVEGDYCEIGDVEGLVEKTEAVTESASSPVTPLSLEPEPSARPATKATEKHADKRKRAS